MPSMVSFLSNWGSTNYEMAIENRFFCQVQFGQVCSRTLKSIIMVERGREVNSSRGISGKACWRIQSELQIVGWGLWPQTLDFAAIRTIFQIQSRMLSSDFSRSFLTKLHLPVRVAVGRRKRKEKQQQLEIAFYSDGHLGSEALLPIRKVPPDLFCYSLLCSPCRASILSLHYSFLPSCIRATASVVPSSTVTNWHAEFSTGTLNPGDQAYRESSFIPPPFGNCLCSSHGAQGGFPHKGPMSRIPILLPGSKGENNLFSPETKRQARRTGVSDFKHIQNELK